MKRKAVHSDVWIGAVLIVLSIFFYSMTGSFSNSAAAIWPRVILIGVAILSSALMAHGIQLTRNNADAARISLKTFSAAMVAFALIAVYAVAMNFTGYFISTAAFLPLGMYLLGQKNWKAIIVITVVLEIFVYVLFVTQLQLRMP